LIVYAFIITVFSAACTAFFSGKRRADKILLFE